MTLDDAVSLRGTEEENRRQVEESKDVDRKVACRDC